MENLTTPLAKLAWELYSQEVLPAMSTAGGLMGVTIKGFLDGMEDQVQEAFQTLDQDLELQASIIARLEKGLAEIKAAGGSTDA